MVDFRSTLMMCGWDTAGTHSQGHEIYGNGAKGGVLVGESVLWLLRVICVLFLGKWKGISPRAYSGNGFIIMVFSHLNRQVLNFFFFPVAEPAPPQHFNLKLLNDGFTILVILYRPCEALRFPRVCTPLGRNHHAEAWRNEKNLRRK